MNIQDDKRVEQYEEGTIQHASIIKLAILDVFANFCVTLGFSIIGSGVQNHYIKDKRYNSQHATVDVSSYL